MGEVGHCGSEVPCPRKQRNIPGQGSNPDRLIRKWVYQPWGHHVSTQKYMYVQQYMYNLFNYNEIA